MAFPLSPIEGQIFKNYIYKTDKWNIINDNLVSDISRVCEISGDGVPEIPDGVAVYSNSYFTAPPVGWIINVTPVNTFSNGIWTLTADSVNEGYYYTGNVFTGIMVIRCRVISGQFVYGNSPSPLSTTNPSWHTVSVSMTSGTPICYGINGVIEISSLYLGTGNYSSKVYDKSGNGNNFTNNNCLPVASPDGKGLLFNGATSFLQANNPVIGATGSILIKFKRDAIGTYRLIDNTQAGKTIGFILDVISNNTMVIRFGSGTLQSNTFYTLSSGTTDFDTIVLTITATACNIQINGVDIPPLTLTSPMVKSTNALFLGKDSVDSSLPLKGIISAFRYDSRIWTSDEMYKLYIDSKGIDSQIKSNTSMPYSLASRDGLGNIGFPNGVCDMTLNFGGASVGVTYGVRQAQWQLVGNRCTVSGYITITNKGSSVGLASISGLPFSVKDHNNSYSPASLWMYLVTYTGQVFGYAVKNTTEVYLEQLNEAGSLLPLTNSNFVNTSAIMFSVTYVIA